MISQGEEYLKAFLSIDNPVYIAIFISIIILFIILYFYRFILRPLRYFYEKKQHSMEIDNRSNIKLFADIDPDPILRADNIGQIIFFNKTATKHFLFKDYYKTNICEMIPEFKCNINDFISKNQSHSIYKQFDQSHYSIWIQGISKLNIIQIYFHDITELIDKERQLKEFNNRLEQELEDERQRIACELHDSVGQNLSTVKIMLNNFSPANYKNQENCDITMGISILNDTISDLKRIAFNLKPRELEDIGIEVAIHSLCNTIGKNHNIMIEVSVLPLNKRLSSKIEINLYRICQEALTNIANHSCSKKAFVRLNEKEGAIQLIISDEGVGFDYDPKKNFTGLGLLSIKERARNMNGTLYIDSSIGLGTILKITIPLSLSSYVQ